MRFNPHLLDEIRARLPVSQVVGRKVALKKKGREWTGLSPFKSEKTPSFFVNDIKGFYHCFASGEHGDIFKFVMTTEGLSFPEAVERLAEEAGVPMPKPDAREEARHDERQRLYALLEAAAAFFVDSFRGKAGAEARRYVAEKRGLQPATVEKFRIGFAPNSKSALREHLAKAGFSVEEMALSGMLISGEDIPVAYDRFRNRVMFPITDLKGRVIAFGGRALDTDRVLPGGGHIAKYLNSPETPLFHKGHILFNAANARQPAHDKGRIIAVEGYMDVVALTEGGFPESVAPLGTALTEDQVKLLWRVVPEPILCFDGDSAGQKAAFRAVDTVLPNLTPGHSVAFAFLTDGLDPDDLIRQKGAAAMEARLAEAKPLVEVLWDREWAKGTWTTPERRARLEHELRQLVGRIQDASVRIQYEREIRRRLNEAFGVAEAVSAPERAAPVAKPATSLPEPPPDQFAPFDYDDQPVAGYDPAFGLDDMPGHDDPYAPPVAPQPAFQHERGYGQGQDRGFKPGGRRGARSGEPFRGGQSGQRGGGFQKRRWPPSPYDPEPKPQPSSELRASRLDADEDILVFTMLNHPWVIDEYLEQLTGYKCASPIHGKLLAAIVDKFMLDPEITPAELQAFIAEGPFAEFYERLNKHSGHKCVAFTKPDAARDAVRVGIGNFLLKDHLARLEAEIVQARLRYEAELTEEALQNLTRLTTERHTAQRSRSATRSDSIVKEGDFAAALARYRVGGSA